MTVAGSRWQTPGARNAHPRVGPTAYGLRASQLAGGSGQVAGGQKRAPRRTYSLQPTAYELSFAGSPGRAAVRSTGGPAPARMFAEDQIQAARDHDRAAE